MTPGGLRAHYSSTFSQSRQTTSRRATATLSLSLSLCVRAEIERRGRKAMTKGRSQTGLLLRAAVTLLAVLGTCGCVVPDQKACLESFDGTEFATDDDVIGCVSKASPLCCDAVSHLTGASSLHSHATPRAHYHGTGSDAGFPFDLRNRSTATSDCRAPLPTAVAARRS